MAALNRGIVHTHHLQEPGTTAHTCTYTHTPAQLHTHHLYEPMDTCAHLQVCSHICGHTHLPTFIHLHSAATHLTQPSGLSAPQCPVSLACAGHSNSSHSTFCFELVACFPNLLPRPSAPSSPCGTWGLGRCLSHSRGGHRYNPKR